MKVILLGLLLSLSTSSFARQYIQCASSYSWDRAVVNLDGENSTLFMTSGVHLPDEVRVIKDLNFDTQDEDYAYYSTKGEVNDFVAVPVDVLGKTINGFNVLIGHRNSSTGYSVEREMSCYSAIYE